jgi:hypothetical protein
MFVGAVVVALGWSFLAPPIVSSILTCLDLMFVKPSMHKKDLLVLKWKGMLQ